MVCYVYVAMRYWCEGPEWVWYSKEKRRDLNPNFRRCFDQKRWAKYRAHVGD